MILKQQSKLWTLTQLALILFHEGVLIFQTVRTWRYENSSLFDQVYLTFNMFGFFLFHMNFMVVLSNSGMHPQLVNDLSRTAKKFYGERFDELGTVGHVDHSGSVSAISFTLTRACCSQYFQQYWEKRPTWLWPLVGNNYRDMGFVGKKRFPTTPMKNSSKLELVSHVCNARFWQKGFGWK